MNFANQFDPKRVSVSMAQNGVTSCFFGSYVEWCAISSINFDGGGSTTYHTKWKSKSIDISPYIDQTIEIKFLVYDVGDSKYDSAVVLIILCAT